MSITLAVNLISSLVVGGATVETDAQAAVTSLSADYVNNVLVFNITQGTTTGQKFVPGTIGPSYQFTIDAITGRWTVTGSSISGTLAGAALTNIQNIFKTLRNNAETFAVNQNLLPGSSQVAWT